LQLGSVFIGMRCTGMHSHIDEADRAALIADLPMKELARQAAQENVSVVDYLKLVRQVLMRQLLTAAHSNDRIGTASLSGRAIECLKEIGRVTGEISNPDGVYAQ
jgi:hypothetical protein